MNFIFVSPHFPENYRSFCKQLKKNGVNVLGIGEASYNSLHYELRTALTEYYRVDNMSDYEQMYRAVAYFSFKYGKINWLESNNEHWLEQDAKLRTDFNIKTGYHTEELNQIIKKSSMKKFYEKANVPSIPWCIVDTKENCMTFAEKIGYPLVIKPDRGMGATSVTKINCVKDLEQFLEQTLDKTFIMEQFIEGELCSYDAIINSKGEVLFEAQNTTPVSMMDAVNQKGTVYYYVEKEMQDDLRIIGRKCVEAFQIKSRFVHFEFFRLSKDQEGSGHKGDLIGLEVNVRPSGGYFPDMLNYANSINAYRIWADMVAFDENHQKPYPEQFYCAFAGRRDNRSYVHSHVEILGKYCFNITLSDRMPEVLAQGMGDQIYLAKFTTKEQVEEFFEFVRAE